MPKLPAGPVSFVSLTDKELVYANDPTGGVAELYYSPDGSTFFELKVRAFEGSSDNHVMVVNDPHHGLVLERLVREGDTIRYLGEYYWQQERVTDLSSVTVVPLPL